MRRFLARSLILLFHGSARYTLRTPVCSGFWFLYVDLWYYIIHSSEAKNGAALPDHIYMDAMGFGMGCCCLQLTFQACNVDEARRMYDALIPVGPILVRAHLYFVFRCNFNKFSACIDRSQPHMAWISCECRLSVECHRRKRWWSYRRRTWSKGIWYPRSNSYYIQFWITCQPLKNDRLRIPKSRYDSVDLYISNDWINRPEYNDSPLPIDEGIYERLRDHGRYRSWVGFSLMC